MISFLYGLLSFISSVFLYFVLPLGLLLYYYVNKKFAYFRNKKIPANDIAFPQLLGDFAEAGTKKHFLFCFQDVYEKFKTEGVVIGFYQMLKPMYLINGLDLISTVLIKDFNAFTDRGVYYNEDDDPLSAHLFSIEGEKWKFLRRKLTPAFTSGKIKSMFSTITEKGDNFVEALDKAGKKGPVDIKNIGGRFCIDVITSCAFGLDDHALENEDAETVKIATQIFQVEGLRIFLMLFVDIFKDLSRKLHIKLFQSHISEYFLNVVRNTINYRKENNIIRPDILNVLMQLKDNGSIEGVEKSSDDRKFTFNEVAAQAFVMFFAGFEPSSTSLTFALLELALNLDIQEKAREEILSVMKNHGGTITYEGLAEMNYLSRLYSETLRKHPPIVSLQRIANYDYTIPGTNHTIEKGQHIFIPVHAIHHDALIYPDPEKFDPDRFLPENIEARHNFAYLPFGDGNRNCIGMRFALVQSKFALATVLSNFKLTLNRKTQLPIFLEPTKSFMTARGGIWLDVERL